MTRDEWEQVFIVRRERTGESFNATTMREYHDEFPKLTVGDGIIAMRRAAMALPSGERTITMRRFADALPEREHDQPKRVHSDPLGASGCRECGGTGLSTMVDADGATRYDKCRTCRPDGAVGVARAARNERGEAWQERLTPERIAQLVAEGIAEGRAERLRHVARMGADADPAKREAAARIRAWLAEHPPPVVPDKVHSLSDVANLIAHDAPAGATSDKRMISAARPPTGKRRPTVGGQARKGRTP